MIKYDNNFPLNTTLIKDVPAAIRHKGEELYNLIVSIETDRTTSSIKSTINKYPFMNRLFVNENTDLPQGIYYNTNGYWIGYSDFTSLPTEISSVDIGRRITIENQTFELKESEGIKAWVLSRSFIPSLFFDLFNYQENNEETYIHNTGSNDTPIQLITKDIIQVNNIFPYFSFNKNSKMNTDKPYVCPDNFTFTATFDNIKRYYDNDEQMDENYFASLMYIQDQFENIKICLAYDKQNHLYLFDKESAIDLNTIISENIKYTLSLIYINNKIEVYINNQKIGILPKNLKDKYLFFSIGSDMEYGHFYKGSFIVGEPSIFDKALSDKELIYNKNYPRCWSFEKKESFLDLNLEEKMELKKIMYEKLAEKGK